MKFKEKIKYLNPYNKNSYIDSSSKYLEEETSEELLELYIYNMLSQHKAFVIKPMSNNYVSNLFDDTDIDKKISREEIINCLEKEYFYLSNIEIYFLGKHLINILNHYNVYSVIRMYYTPEIILCRDKYQAQSILSEKLHIQILKLTPEFDLNVIDILDD